MVQFFQISRSRGLCPKLLIFLLEEPLMTSVSRDQQKKKDGRSEAEAISDAPEKRAGSDWISDEPFADVLYHLPGGVAGNLLFHPYMGVFYFIFTTCIISEIGYVYTERNSPKMETMKKGARGCDRYS